MQKINTACDHSKPPPLTFDLIEMVIVGENSSERVGEKKLFWNLDTPYRENSRTYFHLVFPIVVENLLRRLVRHIPAFLKQAQITEQSLE